MDRDQAVTEYPGFSMEMRSSHVLDVFILVLPTEFCKSNMPKKDKDVILVDEEGHETVTRYLAKGHRLSGGWRRFAMEHELSVEDILVFYRIATAPYKLKVKIYRKSCPMTTAADILTNGP